MFLNMSDDYNKSIRLNRVVPPSEKESVKNVKESSYSKKEIFPGEKKETNLVEVTPLEKHEDPDKDVRLVQEERVGDSYTPLFRDRLQEKIGELLDEEKALVDLYIKAAKAAKKKEKEYRERIAELVEQTERDKRLLDLFRNM